MATCADEHPSTNEPPRPGGSASPSAASSYAVCASAADASALADLQMHWDEAYEIGLDGHIWRATFRRSPDELRAHTASELRELIRADYAYRQRTGQANWRAGDPPGGDHDDSYAEAYDTDSPAREDGPRNGGVRPDYGGLRGERMSI